MADKQTFLNAVQEAIRNERKEQALIVAEDTSFSTYGLDSLDMMNILVSIEERFGSSFEDIEVTEDDTAATFFEKVSDLIGG